MTADAQKDGSERTDVSVHIDTSDLDSREGRDTWASALESTYCEMDLDWGGSHDRFDAELIGRPFGDLYVSTVRADPHTVIRTPAMISETDSDLLLCLVVRGNGHLQQDGRSTDLQHGSFAFLDPSRPFVFASPDEFEQLVVRTPRHLLTSRLPAHIVDAITAHGVSAGDGAGRVVSHLLQEIAGLDDVVSSGTAAALSSSTMDMLITALADGSALHSPTELAHLQDLRRAQQLLESRLHHPDCSVADAARDLGMSVRHLQNLFRKSGATPMNWLYAVRLDRARRLLLESDMTVGDVASTVGFRDVSHFSRSFRRRFGASPGEYRKGSSGR
jgi:AraC-like DNA-binding protein